MIAAFIIIYAVLALVLIVSIAYSASRSMPEQRREDQLLQLMLRTELRSKPMAWQMDEAA